MITLTVRRIAKLQTRRLLICEFEINRDGKIVATKEIHTEKCPKCGGKMKYCIKPIEWMHYKPMWTYSKQLEWDNILMVGRERAKQIPVLMCRKNSEHYYVVYHRKNKKIEKVEKKEAVIPDFWIEK